MKIDNKGLKTNRPSNSAKLFYSSSSFPKIFPFLIVVLFVWGYLREPANQKAVISQLQNFSSSYAALFLGLLVYPIGNLLYIIREKSLLSYGRIEIFVGILSGLGIATYNFFFIFVEASGAYDSNWKELSNPAIWIGLVSAIYVIVRGLDNCQRARVEISKEKEDAKS